MLLLSCEFSLPSGFAAVILTTACWSSREINVGESDCSWRTLGRALWVNCLRVGGLYAACYQTVNAWLLMPYLVFNLNYLHVLCQRYYEGYIEKSQLMWCPAVWNTKHVYIGRIWLIRQSDTHSLTAALDQLRVVASSTSNDPGPRSRQHQQIGQRQI